MSKIPKGDEKTLQKNCIALFQKLGFHYISPNENKKLRDKDLSRVLLKDILRQKLGDINTFTYKNKPYKFSAQNIQNAINGLDVSLDEGLARANQKITDKIMLGTAYEESLEKGEKRSFSLKYIDFENLEKNHFAITEEFRVLKENQSQAKKERRVDIVLFINGIPIVAVELKKSSIDYQNGIRQLLIEQEKGEIQKLFKFIQITLAGNTHKAKYGTVSTPLEHFSTWQEDKKEAQKSQKELSKLITDREITELDLLIYALLRKERLLDIIKNYVFFDGGVKKICRHQQFFAITKTLKEIQKFDTNGVREGGLIWHTQGSGKSITMVLLARLIKLKIPLCKIIIVSDRLDLDRQLSETFKASEVQVKRANSGKDLLKKLQSGASVISTLVQKFVSLKDLDAKDLEQTDFYHNANIFVLVDESHRTQSGLLHRAMRKALKKACYIGFTGTPLLKAEKNSFKKFGGEIHRYTIDEAVRDKAVVPLLYESKMIKQKILDKKALDKKFDIISKELSEDEKRQLQTKWARLSKIASSEQRLELIALDIYTHFKKHLEGTGFKAILATNSRYEAIKYDEIFKTYHKDIKSTYVISNAESSEFDGDKEEISKKYQSLIEIHGNEENYMNFVYNEFVEGDGLDLLIVVDRLLTGFDAPRAKVLYVDKALKEHNLLQAIARVNRLYEGKDYGLIIDYRGLLGELDKALNAYSSLKGFDKEDLENAVTPIRTKIKEAKQLYQALEKLFSKVKHKNDIESYVKILEDEKAREPFKKLLSAFARAFEVALYSETTSSVLSQEEIKSFKEKLKFYNEVRQNAHMRYQKEFDFKQYEKQMQRLLDTFIGTKGVNQLTKLVNIFDSEFEKELEKLKGDNAKADALLNAVKIEITQKAASNPQFYKNLSDKLQHIINEYKLKRLSDEQKLKEAQKLKKRALKKAPNKSYPKGISSLVLQAFYENLKVLLNLKRRLKNQGDEEKILSHVCREIDAIYKECIKDRPEWHENTSVEEQITSAIQNLLWNLEDAYHLKIRNIDEIIKVVRDIALGFYKTKSTKRS